MTIRPPPRPCLSPGGWARFGTTVPCIFRIRRAAPGHRSRHRRRAALKRHGKSAGFDRLQTISQSPLSQLCGGATEGRSPR
ncbi:unnamed protein product [Spirodela intermedia]|uniref:Uncharacterized protein n=1 Tax=Spirodela intermedia TaxID=51605 RepID=A0A7I8KH77_SPIIN|nr:unnamed protein product [Spirodela intermedia]